MKKWLYVASIAVIVAVWIFYFISTRSLIAELTENQTVLANSLSELQKRHYDIALNNPTYAQVQVGLEDLKTTDGNCCDHSKQIQDYFFKNGYQCYIVVMNWKNNDGHVCVAFDTIDQGWVYIEPQNKSEVTVELGKSYNVPGVLYMNTLADRVITQRVIYR
ncbi:MAG: hypothetical protein WC365_03780 [Candidatus Babeliales bacterium]|jgi:hypothetical protein